jgi:hypothetical protein
MHRGNGCCAKSEIVVQKSASNVDGNVLAVVTKLFICSDAVDRLLASHSEAS